MANKKEPKPQKQVKFSRLAAESVPELWMVMFVNSLILSLLAFAFGQICNAIIGTKVAALTTANMKQIFTSWQGPVLIIIAVAFILIYIAIDLFLRVIVTGGILRGEKAGILHGIKESVKSVKRFLNPDGISILVYILFAVPLVGLGFSVGVTKNFAIPNFIMDVVMKNGTFRVIYIIGLLVLLVVGFLFLFSMHAVLLSGMTPKEAKKYSFRLIKKNWIKFLFTMLIVIFAVVLIRFGIDLVVNLILQKGLDPVEATLPVNYIDRDFSDPAVWSSLTDADMSVLAFRVGCAEAVIEGGYLDMFLSLLGSGFIMMFFTKLYLEFDAKERGEETSTWLSRPKGGVYVGKTVLMIGMFVIVGIFSFLISISSDYYFRDKEPGIFAHRSCGTLGFENSVEGLQLALDHGCIGGEIDIQRTKDGYYIINHDNDFARLSGVAKKPSEMTLAEIQALELKDENGGIHKVPMLSDFLVEAKRINATLLLELKGETADEKMADDVVAMVKEYGVEDLVLYISLQEDVMNYLKEKHPECRVSSVFFAGMGKFENLPCDILGIEEGMGSPFLYSEAHEGGKQVAVWTPNTREGLYMFMDSDVDYITTDEVEMAEEIRSYLDGRTEREKIFDRLQDFWEL